MFSNKTLGRCIRTLRKAVKLSQRDVALHLGVRQESISRIENGQRDVTVTELLALARLFSVPLARFFEDFDDPEDTIG